MKKIKDKEINEKDKKEKVLKKGPFYFFKNKKSFLNEKSRGFIWLLKTEIIIIVICFIIILVYNSIPNKIKFTLKYEVGKSCYDLSNFLDSKFSNSKKLDYSIIEESINKNTKLKEEEKNFIFKNLKSEIEENIDYIDLKMVAKRFETLEIVYCKKYLYNKLTSSYELQYPEYTNNKIAGKYNSNFNTIYLYENIETLPKDYENLVYDFNSSNKKALFHELNHVLSKADNSSNSVIMEGVNELFARKYFKEDNYNINDTNNPDDKLAYEPIMPYVNDLEKLIGKDVLREYKFKVNDSILISYLLEIDNNIEEAYKLINGINSINIYEEFNDTEIKEGYTYFYNKKYGK